MPFSFRGDESLSIGTSTVVTLDVPADAKGCWIRAELTNTDAIRVRFRNDPTTTTGLPVLPGEILPIQMEDDLRKVRFLAASGTQLAFVQYVNP